MKNLDAFAGIALSFYLIAVVVNGNQSLFIDSITKQVGFLKWAGALLLLFFIRDSTKSQVADGFIFLALIGMVLNATSSGELQTASDEINTLLSE